MIREDRMDNDSFHPQFFSFFEENASIRRETYSMKLLDAFNWACKLHARTGPKDRQSINIHVIQMFVCAYDKICLNICRRNRARHHSFEPKLSLDNIRKIRIDVNNLS